MNKKKRHGEGMDGEQGLSVLQRESEWKIFCNDDTCWMFTACLQYATFFAGLPLSFLSSRSPQSMLLCHWLQPVNSLPPKMPKMPIKGMCTLGRMPVNRSLLQTASDILCAQYLSTVGGASVKPPTQLWVVHTAVHNWALNDSYWSLTDLRLTAQQALELENGYELGPKGKLYWCTVN